MPCWPRRALPVAQYSGASQRRRSQGWQAARSSRASAHRVGWHVVSAIRRGDGSLDCVVKLLYVVRLVPVEDLCTTVDKGFRNGCIGVDADTNDAFTLVAAPFDLLVDPRTVSCLFSNKDDGS